MTWCCTVAQPPVSEDEPAGWNMDFAASPNVGHGGEEETRNSHGSFFFSATTLTNACAAKATRQAGCSHGTLSSLPRTPRHQCSRLQSRITCHGDSLSPVAEHTHTPERCIMLTE